METSEVYLRAMMSLVARQTFSPERLAEIVSPQSNPKLIEAFNLCDGSRTQTEVINQLSLDSGNFSKQIKKWVDEGVMIRVVQDGNSKPVHVYPLPEKFLDTKKKKGTSKNG